LTQQAKPVVAWMVSSRTASAKNAASPRRSDEDAEAWADYLLDDRPGMLSAIFLILLFGWPLVVSFGAFDLYAGDISSRQLRYQLLRADRGSIFFGRLIGMLLTFAAVLVLLGVTVTVYMGCKLSVYAGYSWSELAGWAVYGTVAMVCVSVPYIALCAWLSAACSGSFFSLTMASLAIGGVPLLSLFARLQHEAGGYVLYLLPWGFQMRLFHHEPLQVALAVGGCALHTLLFTWLGYRKFTTRDL
jgi:ABC-type transport system involved in multi-copper enzyme maturation permease subunit